LAHLPTHLNLSHFFAQKELYFSVLPLHTGSGSGVGNEVGSYVGTKVVWVTKVVDADCVVEGLLASVVEVPLVEGVLVVEMVVEDVVEVSVVDVVWVVDFVLEGVDVDVPVVEGVRVVEGVVVLVMAIVGVGVGSVFALFWQIFHPFSTMD